MFKQPRVPEYRESEGVSKYLKALTLFLKDFCQDAWVASGQANKSIDAISYPVTSVNKKTGDVELNAEDVGALASKATAVDSAKLGGKLPEEIKQGLLLALHPVGSLYLSMESANPADLFGGEWEQLKDRFLLAAGESYPAGSTGGSKEHEHGLTQAQAAIGVGLGESGYWIDIEPSGIAFESTGYVGPMEEVGVEDPFQNETGTKLLGNTDPAIGLPPYISVYVWKRIA